MAFNFSSTAGTSGITTITLSATSSTELYNIIENFTLANESNHSLLMPVVQRAYNPSQPYINLIPSAMTWPSSGGYQTIQIQTNENWSWEMDEWLSPSVNGGMSGNTIIPIMASENTGSTRTGEIKAVCLSDSSITASTSVEQAGSYVKPYIGLGYYLYMATPESASTAVTVSSNIEWYTMTDSRWITLNTVSGSGNGSISFTIDENTAEFNREGIITVFNYDEDIYVELVIRQASSVKPFIIVTPDSFIVEPTGSTGNLISVSANCDYDIEADVDWITVNSASGSGYGSVSFSTAPSDRFVSNVGNIVFSNSAVSAYVRVERKAAQHYLYAETTGITSFYNETKVQDVNVYSDVDWAVDIFWNGDGLDGVLETHRLIDVTPLSGSGNSSIRITVNSGSTIRTGGVILRNIEYNLSYTIYIEQTTIPTNVIYYTSTNGQIVTPNETYPFGNANLIRNVYENGRGMLEFDGVVIVIPQDAFKDKTTLQTITIPDTVVSLDKNCFYGSGLISMFIPDNTSQFGNGALSHCSELTSVRLPDYANLSASSIFYGSGLVSLTIPEGYPHIGTTMCSHCDNLESLYILGDLEAIRANAFYQCPSLKYIECHSETAPTLGMLAFDAETLPENGVVHYPAGSDYSSWVSEFPNSWTFIDDL